MGVNSGGAMDIGWGIVKITWSEMVAIGISGGGVRSSGGLIGGGVSIVTGLGGRSDGMFTSLVMSTYDWGGVMSGGGEWSSSVVTSGVVNVLMMGGGGEWSSSVVAGGIVNVVTGNVSGTMGVGNRGSVRGGLMVTSGVGIVTRGVSGLSEMMGWSHDISAVMNISGGSDVWFVSINNRGGGGDLRVVDVSGGSDGGGDIGFVGISKVVGWSHISSSVVDVNWGVVGGSVRSRGSIGWGVVMMMGRGVGKCGGRCNIGRGVMGGGMVSVNREGRLHNFSRSSGSVVDMVTGSVIHVMAGSVGAGVMGSSVSGGAVVVLSFDGLEGSSASFKSSPDSGV
jgi:hypothetical protein